MLSVVIVDDSKEYCRAAGRLLDCWQRHAHSLAQGVRVVERVTPSVVLLDVTFPGEGSGMDWIERYREASPRSAIVIITALYDDGEALSALRKGATAYVEKGDSDLLRKVVLAARSTVPTTFVRAAAGDRQ